MHRHDERILSGVYENGSLIAVRVLHDVIGGREASRAEKTAVENQYVQPKPGDGFKAPFDLRYIGDYHYSVENESTIRFTPLLRDKAEGEGSGMFSINEAGDVVAMQYTPSILPPYAASGTVRDEFAQVLPDFWARTREVQQYVGHYGPFRSHATVEITESDFQPFPDVSSALAALDAGRV